MDFALLGVDLQTLELVRAIATGSPHRLVCACELGPHATEIKRLIPDLRLVDNWESLLETSTTEAVIVASSLEEQPRAEQLRTLVQAGVALLVSHPVYPSMLIYYELDMIREESSAPLLANLPARWHPAIERLRALLVGDGHLPIGKVEQIVFDRETPLRARADVRAQFARDADLVRALCGELATIGAMGQTAGAADDTNLGVQLAADNGLLVRWAAAPADSSATGRISLLGASGRARLDMPEGGASWTLEIAAAGQSHRETFPDWSAPATILDCMERLTSGQPLGLAWSDAARSVEIAEALDRSLAKRRQIDLHQETFSEESTFKGTMAALGCALLLSCAALFLLAGVAEALGVPHADNVLYLMAAALVIFLALQLLRLALPRARSAPPPGRRAQFGLGAIFAVLTGSAIFLALARRLAERLLDH